MIIYITNWLVNFCCLALQFLTLKIVTILILEHACLSYISRSEPTLAEALDWAYSQFCASNIQIDLIKQFSAPPKEYSILQFTEFILKHHFWLLHLFCTCLSFCQYYPGISGINKLYTLLLTISGQYHLHHCLRFLWLQSLHWCLPFGPLFFLWNRWTLGFD